MSLSLGTRRPSGWRRSHRRSPSAWGFDIGTREIKAVQLKVQNGQLCYHVRLSIPRTGEDSESSTDLADALTSVFSNARLRGQKDAYAVVSFSRTQLDTFELPPGSANEMRLMVRAELEDAGHRRFVSDCWPTATVSSESRDGQTASISALSMPESESADIAESLLAAGLRCRVLDGLPFALSRAATCVTNSPSVAAVDLGASMSTFIAIQNGRPRMIRPLRDSSTTELLKRLADRLNLSLDECWSLLPSLAEVSAKATDGWRQLVQSVTEAYLSKLAPEVTRTVSYLDRNSASKRIEEVWLFGAGATWPGLREKLEVHLARPVKIWSLGTTRNDSSTDDAIFGPATAMALLSMPDRPRLKAKGGR